MNDSVRRAVAYIAGRAVNGGRASSVYDYAIGKFTNFSGDVSERSVSVYDFDASCHISGSRTGNRLSLYHYGVGGHINVALEKGGKLSGYDFSSGSHFSGTVAKNSVNIYDFGLAKYFNYSLS